MIHFITFIQIVDTTVHILTNQAELLRIISNFLIVVWLYVLMSKKNKNINIGVVSTYIIFNFIFLVLNGFTNNGNQEFFYILLFL